MRERRIFYVDVGNCPRPKPVVCSRFDESLQNKLVYDASSGEMRDDRKFMSCLKITGFLVVKVVRVQKLHSTVVKTSARWMMFCILKRNSTRPRCSNVTNEADTGFNMGRASEISRDELNFQKFINRLRNKFNMLFINFSVQCILKGIVSQEEFYKISQDLRFDYVSDSFFTESKEYEIIKERLDVMREMTEYIGEYYSREYVRKNILRQTDAEIKQQDKQIDIEREKGLLPEKNGDGGF